MSLGMFLKNGGIVVTSYLLLTSCSQPELVKGSKEYWHHIAVEYKKALDECYEGQDKLIEKLAECESDDSLGGGVLDSDTTLVSSRGLCFWNKWSILRETMKGEQGKNNFIHHLISCFPPSTRGLGVLVDP